MDIKMPLTFFSFKCVMGELSDKSMKAIILAETDEMVKTAIKISFICTKDVLSATRICSRTRDWPACVALLRNNFICVFIVKRD
jgi:hypothetical protein